MNGADVVPTSISDAEALDALKVLEERRKQRRKQKIIKIAVAAVVVAAVAAGIYFFTQQSNANEAPDEPAIETDVVVREDYSVPISGSGTLRAAASAAVTPEVEGTVTEIFVEEGQHVEKGDRLFTMESPEIENAIKEAQEKIDEAGRGVAKADAAVSAAQSSYNKANKKYKSVKAKYDKAKKQYQKEKTKADEAKAKAEADGKAAYDKAYAAAIKNADDPDKPTAAEKKAAEDEAQKAYDAAYKKVTIPKVSSADVDKYAESLEAASEARDAAQGEVDAAKEELSSAQSEVESAQSDYNSAVEDREKCTVTAPQAGTLVSLGVKVGDSTGSSEGSSDSVARISNLSSMKISIEVSENDIANIEVGQKAKITPSAFGDVELEGKVTSIASSATGDDDSGGFDGGSVTFAVEVEIEKPDGRLKPGMSASVQILTQEIKNALIVPASALSEEEDGTYVEVVIDEETMQTEMKKVKVVTQDSSRAVIKKGVSEGDVVVVSSIDFAAEYDESMSADAEGDVEADMEADVDEVEAEDEALLEDEDIDLEGDLEE